MKKYYEAYEERYKTIHQMGLEWAEKDPSPIVSMVIEKYSLSKNTKILEIGCGEGRDSIYLYNKGYNVYGSDISKEAVKHCIIKSGSNNFFQLDAINGVLHEKYDYIFAISVVHMLVIDEDRNKFLRFIKEHLNKDGYALICTMGDGTQEYETDVNHAFDTVERIHESSNQSVAVAATSCRIVNWNTFEMELSGANFNILDRGVSLDIPGFGPIMYAIAQ